MSISKFENLELLARVTAIDIGSSDICKNVVNGGSGNNGGCNGATTTIYDSQPLQELNQIKAKRKRASTFQIDSLRKVYNNEGQFPSSYRRDELAKELKMSPRSVQIWFQNQRQLSKKE